MSQVATTLLFAFPSCDVKYLASRTATLSVRRGALGEERGDDHPVGIKLTGATPERGPKLVAKNETPATPESPDAPARYWPGYDTLHDEIVRVTGQLAKRNGKNYRDSWWRFNTRNKVLGPLESATRYRRAGIHALILNRHPHGSETEEHHCSCGLVVDMPERPDLLTTELLDERDAIFLSAPGHIDWRMRDPEHYPAPEPEPAPAPEPDPAPAVKSARAERQFAEEEHPPGPRYWDETDTTYESFLRHDEMIAALPTNGPDRDQNIRNFYRRQGMMRQIWGPERLVVHYRQQGMHEPYYTYWPGPNRMPVRHCSCGLIIDAPDIINTDETFDNPSSTNGTHWPDDPAERERAERAFFDAEGHIDWRMRAPDHYAVPLDNLENEDDAE